MREIHILFSSDGRSEVRIDKGELISYRKDGYELIHQKGSPGWRNSDTEMFPVIGPTVANNFVVKTNRGEAIQDQHGLLREMMYAPLKQTKNSIAFQKKYKKNTKVSNSKYPDKSTKQEVFWPYSFEFIKKYHLSDEALSIKFEIKGEKGMPFMLGYHPAFSLSGNTSEVFKVNKEHIGLQDILDAGSAAYPVIDTDEITLVKNEEPSVSVRTVGFNNFMLWTETSTMVCIEPITAYPNSDTDLMEQKLFKYSNEIDHFEVIITPFFIQ